LNVKKAKSTEKNVFLELSTLYCKFLAVWSGVLSLNFGLKFNFRKKDPKLGKLFFRKIKDNWCYLIKRLENIDFSRTFLIGEDRVTCELIYLIFYLDFYLRKRKLSLWVVTTKMINELILNTSPEKLSGLLKHYKNSKMFSKQAYNDILIKVRIARPKAYTIHCMECTDLALEFAQRDFAGVNSFYRILEIAKNKQTIERVYRITKTTVISETNEVRDGYKWSIKIVPEEDGIKWGAITVLLILTNDYSTNFSFNINSSVSKLLNAMLNGNYSISFDLFFYFNKKFKPYINKNIVMSYELPLISKFLEDLSEYIYPEVDRLSKKFLNSIKLEDIPNCNINYDYVVDAIRIRVRKKLATHLEYTCLVTKPVKGYYLHFVVLKVNGKHRYICLACTGKNVRPKDAFYMFDNAKLKKIFEVKKENSSFKILPITFEELKKLAENSEDEERKLARIKLKEAGIII